jgi:hypothetical protein
MAPKWKVFKPENGWRGMPKERRCVLVAIDTRDGCSAGTMVGYLRYAAGDKKSPYFVIPGQAGPKFTVTHWADCLGNDFDSPAWPNWTKPNA